MAIVHSIDLNLRDFRVPAVLHMTQGDAGGQRIISANLFDGSAAYTVPTGAKVMFRYSKKDHTGGMYDKDELNHSISVNGSVVQIPVAAAVLTVSGRVEAEVDIYTNNNKERVAAFPFFIECEKSAYSDGAITKSEYYKAAFDGESAYDYAKSKGYTGTEEEFATLMASLASSESDILETKKKIDFIFDPTFSNMLQVYGFNVLNKTLGGVEYTADRYASTITASGDTTASGGSFMYIIGDLNSPTPLPHGINPGDTCRISIEWVDGSTQTSSFYVRTMFYKDDGTQAREALLTYMGRSDDIEIPHDCTKMNFRFQVAKSVVIDDHVTCRVTFKKLTESYDNVTYSIPDKYAAKKIPDGTDYDNLTTPGCYYRSTSDGSDTLAHCPTIYGHRLLVIQTSSLSGRLQQIIVASYSSSSSKIYVRDKYGDDRDWTSWERIALSGDIDAVAASIQTEAVRVNGEIARLDSEIALNTNRITAANQLVSDTNDKIDMLENPNKDLLAIYSTKTTVQTHNGIEFTYDKSTSTVSLKVVGAREDNSYFTVIPKQNIPKWIGKSSRYLISIEMDGEFQSSSSYFQILETPKNSTTDIETKIRKDTIHTFNNDTEKVLIRLRIGPSEPISDNFSVTIKMTEYTNYASYDLKGTSELISDGTDYDSIVTAGSYYCSGADSAKTMTNCPVQVGHRMYVTYLMNSAHIYQELITAHESYHDVYSRKKTTRGWTDWHYMVHDGDVAKLTSRLDDVQSIEHDILSEHNADGNSKNWHGVSLTYDDQTGVIHLEQTGERTDAFFHDFIVKTPFPDYLSKDDYYKIDISGTDGTKCYLAIYTFATMGSEGVNHYINSSRFFKFNENTAAIRIRFQVNTNFDLSSPVNIHLKMTRAHEAFSDLPAKPMYETKGHLEEINPELTVSDKCLIVNGDALERTGEVCKFSKYFKAPKNLLMLSEPFAVASGARQYYLLEVYKKNVSDVTTITYDPSVLNLSYKFDSASGKKVWNPSIVALTRNRVIKFPDDGVERYIRFGLYSTDPSDASQTMMTSLYSWDGEMFGNPVAFDCGNPVASHNSETGDYGRITSESRLSEDGYTGLTIPGKAKLFFSDKFAVYLVAGYKNGTEVKDNIWPQVYVASGYLQPTFGLRLPDGYDYFRLKVRRNASVVYNSSTVSVNGKTNDSNSANSEVCVAVNYSDHYSTGRASLVKKRAEAISNIKWTPVANVVARGVGEFKAGVEYTGVPYSSWWSVPRFLGWHVSYHTFINAVNDEDSTFYQDIQEDGAPGYGLVCSSFATLAAGWPHVDTNRGFLMNPYIHTRVTSSPSPGCVMSDFAEHCYVPVGEANLGDVEETICYEEIHPVTANTCRYSNILLSTDDGSSYHTAASGAVRKYMNECIYAEPEYETKDDGSKGGFVRYDYTFYDIPYDLFHGSPTLGEARPYMGDRSVCTTAQQMRIGTDAKGEAIKAPAGCVRINIKNQNASRVIYQKCTYNQETDEFTLIGEPHTIYRAQSTDKYVLIPKDGLEGLGTLGDGFYAVWTDTSDIKEHFEYRTAHEITCTVTANNLIFEDKTVTPAVKLTDWWCSRLIKSALIINHDKFEDYSDYVKTGNIYSGVVAGELYYKGVFGAYRSHVTVEHQ